MCDITDKPIQRYNIRNCTEFTSTILNESEDYNSCFILNTVVNNLQEGQQNQTNSCIRYVDFRTQSIFDSNMPIALTISTDAEMRKGFANTISKRIPLLKDYCKSRNCDIGDIITFRADNNIVYNLITKTNHYEKPTIDTIKTTLLAMRDHALGLNLRCIAMPKIACGLDGMDWREISSLIEQTFKNSGITIYVYTSKDDIDKLQKVETSTLEQEEVLEIIESELEIIESELIEKCKEDERELATDFSTEAKELCRPKVNDQFPKFRDKLQSNRIINKAVTDFVIKQNGNRVQNIEYLEKFLDNFDFTQSDLTDDELFELIEIILQDNDVYSHHKYDIGRTKHKFHLPLKKDATFKKQRRSKIPIHLRDKLEKLMGELIQAGIIWELNENDDMNSWFVNPVIILPKKDYVKLVIDARYLNSIADTSNSSWPLEPLNVLMTRITGTIFTSSDLSSAYNQVPLTEDTQKVTSFIVGCRQYTYQVGFYGLKPLPSFFKTNALCIWTPYKT